MTFIYRSPEIQQKFKELDNKITSQFMSTAPHFIHIKGCLKIYNFRHVAI